MCGIVGVINLNGRSVDPEVVVRMAQLQRHRGPDDQGMRLFSLQTQSSAEYVQTAALQQDDFSGAVAFNRLNILDLSRNGHQPMCSADGRVFIAFNGEIFNAFDSVPELQRAGFHFRGKSDTEVLLNLYLQYGLQETLQRLNGMFAFCIVDLRSRTVHLVRDRLGIKPLYWTTQSGVFMFSSEIKSFLAHPDFVAAVNHDCIDECLAFRYCTGEQTLFKNVQPLPPAHHLELTLESRSLHRYWSIPENAPLVSISFSQAVDQLQQLLKDSVQRQLVSDVRVGCQLSGGIDSSLISIMAGEYLGSAMDVISIIPDDPEYSEEKWILRAAARADVVSHRYCLSTQYVVDHLDKITWHLDEPINVPAVAGMYCLSSQARHFMTVILSGEGADELFGGYERYGLALARIKVLPWLPILRRLPGKIHRFARDLGDFRMTDPADWYIFSTMAMPPDMLAQVHPEGSSELAFQRRKEIFKQGRGEYQANCLRYDLQTWLVNLLNQQDKMAMAHSMENRVPFLDNKLVEFARSLPGAYLFRGAWGKWTTRSRRTKMLLKALARRYFEPDFVYRKKVGFALPVRKYCNSPQFRRLMEERILPGLRSRGLLNPKTVRDWWTMAMRDSAMEGPLWPCIALEIWMQQFIDSAQHISAQSAVSEYGA